MSKHSELAERLSVGMVKDLQEAATAVRELEQENERLKSDNEALNRALGYQQMLTEETRNVGIVEGDAAEARIAELEAERDRLRGLLRRYRSEVPLGHQPHMIAHEVDAALQEGE